MNDLNTDKTEEVDAPENAATESTTPQFAPGSAEALQQRVTELSEKVAGLESELEQSKAKADENMELALRTKADGENIRRRSRIDVENAHKYGVERIARELLGVVDSFESGLNSANQESVTTESLKEGMQLTHKLLLDTLDKFNIKLLNPLGEEFNPKEHEALTMQETNEVKPNHVMTVVQPGFTIAERVLRPARVIVAKAVAESEKKSES